MSNPSADPAAGSDPVSLMVLLQEDNGMPIHLKGGSSDALLYRATMVLTVLGEKSSDQSDPEVRSGSVLTLRSSLQESASLCTNW